MNNTMGIPDVQPGSGTLFGMGTNEPVVTIDEKPMQKVRIVAYLTQSKARTEYSKYMNWIKPAYGTRTLKRNSWTLTEEGWSYWCDVEKANTTIQKVKQ